MIRDHHLPSLRSGLRVGRASEEGGSHPLLGASLGPHYASDTDPDAEGLEPHSKIGSSLWELWLLPRISSSTFGGTEAFRPASPPHPRILSAGPAARGSAAWELKGLPHPLAPLQRPRKPSKNKGLRFRGQG